jgi:hypothetical protein
MTSLDFPLRAVTQGELDRTAPRCRRHGHGRSCQQGGERMSLRVGLLSPEDVHDLDGGYYASPVRLEGGDWISLSPCHRRRLRHPIVDFASSGEASLICPVCARLWAVIWDPADLRGRGFALWIE